MAEVTKWFSFDAAHQLYKHDGKCSRLHGHTYNVGVTCRGEVDLREFVIFAEGSENEVEIPNSKEGMVVDFDIISQAFRPYIERSLDHYFIDPAHPSTAENLGCLFWHQLQTIEGIADKLHCIRVQETPTSEAVVWKGDYVRWLTRYQ